MNDIIESGEAEINERRSFFRAFGTGAAVAGGLSLLSACGSEKGSVTATPTPTPVATLAPAPVAGPSYTANDTDRLNFLLQVQYLLASYFSRGVLGTSLDASLTTGAGTAGAVTGGAQVTFDEPALASAMREIAYNLIAHVTTLRTRIGTTVTAIPAINIAADGGFAAIALRPSNGGAPAALNPYASGLDFLIGAIALTSVSVTAFRDAIRLMTDKSLASDMAGMLAAQGAHDTVVRSALWQRGSTSRPPLLAGESATNVFETVRRSSDARDAFNGLDLDAWLGADWGSEISATDGNGLALRRSAEQTLNVLYANRTAVSSGGFYPSGINGLIRVSRGG